MDEIGSEAHERLSAITDEQWGDILRRLRLHAEIVVSRKTWRTPGGMLPKGYSPKELANEAIRRLLVGTRKWVPEKEPDVLKVLMGTVNSIASELVESPDHTKGNRFGQAEDDSPLSAMPAEAPDPLSILEAQDTAAERKEQRDWIWEHLKDDEEEEIVLCIEEGLEKPAEIAKETGKPVERIYQVLRNMRRRLSRERDEMSKVGQEGLR